MSARAVTVTLPEDQWLVILSWFGPVEGEGFDDSPDHEAGEALEADAIEWADEGDLCVVCVAMAMTALGWT